ncbi:hypothetical protein [Actibacterium ureilyticum]|uniref:hypothetical protein n=1 Tax=Actibacterium ureilyticum TaxID=1590614 RepID=UPI000BAAD944|nr:hypothetical protein [Actibacterium ureilyticum]
MSALERQFNALNTRCHQFEQRLQTAVERANADHIVTPREQQLIAQIRGQLEQAYDRRRVIEDRLRTERGEAPIQHIDPTNPADNTVTGGWWPATDSRFTGAFHQSNINWSLQSQVTLNSVRTYMIQREEPSGLSVDDVVDVITTIVPGTDALGTALKIGQILQRAYRSALSNLQGPTPSLNEIHGGWNEALRSLNSADFSDDYSAFVAKYRRDEGIPDDERRMPSAFVDACRDYWQTYLPRPEAVERAFVRQILETVQDDDVPFVSRDAGAAGFASVKIRFDPLGGTFYGHEGYIDDCPEDLMQAIDQVYRNGRVIDLPVPIRVEIWEVDLTQTVIERRSSTAGNTSFTLTSGPQEMMDRFIAARGYQAMMVSHLEHD